MVDYNLYNFVIHSTVFSNRVIEPVILHSRHSGGTADTHGTRPLRCESPPNTILPCYLTQGCQGPGLASLPSATLRALLSIAFSRETYASAQSGE